ncbi:MAG: hypothetical protein R3C11_29095 [Planctomycetaceae bacterium]
MSLRPRNQFFKRKGNWTRLKLQQQDRQLVMLSRIVLHPDYRGLGLAHRFVQAACRQVDWPWIECLSEMGHFNPFLEKAGFQRLGLCGRAESDIEHHSVLYGSTKLHGQKRKLTQTTHKKSRYARPVYYLFDNRENHRKKRQNNIETDRSSRQRGPSVEIE